MNHKRLGMALIVCAPSGAGKSTLISRLRAEFPGLGFSISCTTRAPRAGEMDGREYYFVSREDFMARRQAGEFAEWAEVHGNFYGTPLPPVRKRLAAGEDVIFDVDVQGAAALRPVFADGVFVFVLPPTFEILKQRLTSRGTDDPLALRRRLGNAAGEIARAGEFGYLLVNDDLEEACAMLRAIYLAERQRAARLPGLAQSILDGFPKG